MIIIKITLFTAILYLALFLTAQAQQTEQDFTLESPDKDIRVTLSLGEKLSYSVAFKNRTVIAASPLSMTVREHGTLGYRPRLQEVKRQTIKGRFTPVIKTKSEFIDNHCHELTLVFKGGFALDFRAYDEGAAYRFRTRLDGDIHILHEEVNFNFTGRHSLYFPEEESFLTHSERLYRYLPLNQVTPERMSCVPVLVEIPEGPKVAISEADLQDYPGMYLTGNGDTSLVGRFPAVARREKQTRDRTVEVTEREEYIARVRGSRSFPWRLMVMAENDGELIASQLVFKLSPPLELEETSWITPGKVAWDWWNALNLFDVDFKAGVNTATYKYYIEFAAKYGIEYVILDEGWYILGDLFRLNPDIDMNEIMRYAESRGVGIILWVVWKTLDDQLIPALDRFQKWGVKGIKVDFMQRDDQAMVNYYWKIAREAARRRLLVDFHGAYKPAGLRRAYPNVLTREGVIGLEHNKWSESVTPEHNLTLPFIRMLAGPMDYTPGAMINAQKDDFKAVFNRPMSMGTRCHQLAMYVVFESPLQMLADSPSHYLREPDCMDFLAQVPTVWDETRVLDAKVADYVLVARRNGDDWYVGAMTDETAREMRLPLSFLDERSYRIDIYQDGINADRYGSDFRRLTRSVSRGEILNLKLAPGGGWAARITPSQNRTP